MRKHNDLTPEEQKAAIVWKQKLADITLSKEQHDRAKFELDKIYETGEIAMAAKYSRKVKELEQKVDMLEDKVIRLYESQQELYDVYDSIRADLQRTIGLIENNQPAPRGRPQNRFYVSGKRGAWNVHDRQGEVPSEGPYPNKGLANDMAARYNSDETLYSDGVADQTIEVPTVDLTVKTHIIEEMPDGGTPI